MFWIIKITIKSLVTNNSFCLFFFYLIVGIDKNNIYANDPMWDYRGGNHKYAINDFMYAIYATAYRDLDNAAIMKIKRLT